MTRKKVTLEWIENDGARRASFRKRKTGLIKKVSELSILCDVNASIVIYSPDEIEPTVWPSHEVVQEQFMKFKNMPEMERMKKMSNHDTYLRDRVSKLHEQLFKTQRMNKESDVNDLMHQINQGGKGLHECSLSELNGLAWFCNEKMKDINRRIEFHRQLPYEPGTAPLPPPPPPSQDSAAADEEDHGRTPTELLLWDQWFPGNNFGLRDPPNPNDMGLPPYRPHAQAASTDHMGFHQPRGMSVGGDNFGPLGTDHIGLGLGLNNLFDVQIGSRSTGIELGLASSSSGLARSGSNSTGTGITDYCRGSM